jgi:hypothetical protein
MKRMTRKFKGNYTKKNIMEIKCMQIKQTSIYIDPKVKYKAQMVVLKNKEKDAGPKTLSGLIELALIEFLKTNKN